MTESGHASWTKRVWPWALAMALVLGPALDARAEGPPRAALVEPRDPELASRIGGQTADLPWAIQQVGPTDMPSGATAGLHQAEALGRRVNAQVVIWLTSSEDRWIVHVADVDQGRLLVRRIAPSQTEGRLARSAALEAAALVVRSALQSLGAGGDIGVVPPEAHETAHDPGPHPPPQRVERPSHSPPRPHLTHHLGATVGWHVIAALDGGPVHHGPRLEAGWRIGEWWVDFRLDVGLRRSVAGSQATIRLWRLGWKLGTARDWEIGETWRLGGHLGVGGVWMHRTTARVGDALRRTDPMWVRSAAASLSVRTTWAPTEHLLLRLELGADAVVPTPRFRVDGSDGRSHLAEAWPVQPWIALSVGGTTPRL